MSVSPLTSRQVGFADPSLTLAFAPVPTADGGDDAFARALEKARQAYQTRRAAKTAATLLENPDVSVLQVTGSFVGEISEAAANGDQNAIDFANFAVQAAQVAKDDREDEIKRQKLQAIIKYEQDLKSRLCNVFNVPVEKQPDLRAAEKKKLETEPVSAPWRPQYI